MDPKRVSAEARSAASNQQTPSSMAVKWRGKAEPSNAF
jgi:hypothetical protein